MRLRESSRQRPAPCLLPLLSASKSHNRHQNGVRRQDRGPLRQEVGCRPRQEGRLRPQEGRLPQLRQDHWTGLAGLQLAQLEPGEVASWGVLLGQFPGRLCVSERLFSAQKARVMPQGRAGARPAGSYPELSPPHPEGGAAPAVMRRTRKCHQISFLRVWLFLLFAGMALTAVCTCPVSMENLSMACSFCHAERSVAAAQVVD